jgi:hypothetical protein
MCLDGCVRVIRSNGSLPVLLLLLDNRIKIDMETPLGAARSRTWEETLGLKPVCSLLEV